MRTTLNMGWLFASALIAFGCCALANAGTVTITSASVEPSTAVVGQTVQFSAAATTTVKDGEIVFTWFFGDGLSASFPNLSRHYPTAGSYTAKITASLKSDPSDSASMTFPVTINAAPPPAPFTVTKPALSMTFSKEDSEKPADSLSFSGALPLPDGFTFNNKAASVHVAQGVTILLSLDFFFDSKGKLVKNSNLPATWKASKPKAGMTPFSVKYSKADLLGVIGKFPGFTIESVKDAPLAIPVSVTIEGSVFTGTLNMKYTCNGKTGKGKS